ncbi:MAG TPA: cytochrome c [Vicinamibacterales bacterium]|jgi:mono/diheme cytochrome c family protein
MIRSTHSIAVLVLVLVASVLVGAQKAQTVPSLADESLSGKDSFARYCAACHGVGGRGDGPLAGALKGRPADLTMLARRNRGVFPRDRVRAELSGVGRTIAAHGPTEMPLWASLFRAFEADARVRVRIENLVDYLEMLQTSGPSTDAVAECGSRGDGVRSRSNPVS